VTFEHKERKYMLGKHFQALSHKFDYIFPHNVIVVMAAEERISHMMWFLALCHK
jgi:hypothetical protein